MFKKIVSTCMIVVGLSFIVAGTVNFFSKPELMIDKPAIASSKHQLITLDSADITFGAKSTLISSATFGADFYTYIYNGVVKAVTALDTISTQLSASSLADQAIYDGLRKTIDAQNESNNLLQSNYIAVNQLSRVSYEIGIKQIEQSRIQNTLIMLGIGFVILFYGLLRLSESLHATGKIAAISAQKIEALPSEEVGILLNKADDAEGEK